jgi:hypothetical protein
LSGANLKRSFLSRAILIDANLSGADLSKADLNGADLRNANLNGANMRKVSLIQTNLRDTAVDQTTQISDKWRLVWEILNNGAKGKNLSNADLSDADLRYIDLSKINLRGADLSGTDLSEANFSEADLRKANLSKARLTEVNLEDAIISGVNLEKTQYEPASSPHRDFLGGIRGLSTVWFEDEEQSGLLMLRTALKDAGLRNLEREATYAIEYLKTEKLPWYKKWAKRFLFEWTSGYGLHYLRPLLILCAMIIAFSFVYIYPMFVNGKSSIYRIWPYSKIKDEKEKDEPERLIFDILPNNQIEKDSKLFLTTAVYALYFSFLSTFHIGYLNLNLGNWITRIQPHDYSLSATGNVRIFAGLQSLLGTYLLALWILTHFFRPFH